MGKYYKNYEDEIFDELKDEVRKKKAFRYARLLPVYLTRKECKQLIDFYQKGKKAPRNKLIIRLLYATGMRVGELENIKIADFDFKDRTLFIREGKGTKDRYVILDKVTKKNILEYIKQENLIKLKDNLFNVKKRQTQYIIEKAGNETGIDEKYEAIGRKFSAHSLRHAFATHCFENGIDLLTLKALLGHEYLETTDIYVNTSIKMNKNRYDLTNPFVKGEKK